MTLAAPTTPEHDGGWRPRVPDVTMFLWTTAAAALIPFVSLRARSLGMSPAAIGLLLGAHGLIALLASAIADRTLSSMGARRVMLSGALGAALALLGAGGTRSPVAFGALLLVYWGVFPVVAVACQTLVVTTASTPRRDHAVGMHSFYTSLGHPIGPMLSTTAVHTWTTEGAAFPVGAVVLVGSAVAALATPTRRASATSTPRGHAAGSASTGASFVEDVRDAPPAARTALLAALAAQFCYDAWNAFYPLALTGSGHSATAIGVVFGVFGLVVPLVRPLLGTLAARLGRIGVLLLAFLCVAAGGWAAAIPASRVGVAACVLLLGIGFGLVFPVTVVLATAGAAVDAVGRRLAARFFMMMSGGMLGPVAIGVVAARHLPAAMAATAVVATGACVALWAGGARAAFLDTEKTAMLP